MTTGRRLFCGVDLGACATKLLLLDQQGTVYARVVRSSGIDYAATSRECLSCALADAGAEPGDVARTVATGYGRRSVAFADDCQTEIQCHGVGCYHELRRALTIVDIGGQDNKIIHLDERGGRLDFKMNRKCAAGTGAFIEEIALRLGLEIGEMDRLAQGTREGVHLSSFCTVFAKTEILSHLQRGVDVGRIVRGAFFSVVSRILEMDPLEGTVALTGGVVAHNPTVAEILSERLGRKVEVPPYPQLIGALGAALWARKQWTSAAPQP